jgi:hypothetical protein
MRFKLFLEQVIDEEAVLSLDNIGIFHSLNDDILAIYRKDDDIKKALDIGNSDLFLKHLPNNILGVMYIETTKKYYDQIVSVAAEKGYGPLLYLLAMQLSKLGLIADQDEGYVSDEAKNVWKNFYDGKGSKLVKIVGTIKNDHEEQYLKHAYKNVNDYDIKDLINQTNKLIDSSTRYSIPAAFRKYSQNIISKLYE